MSTSGNSSVPAPPRLSKDLELGFSFLEELQPLCLSGNSSTGLQRDSPTGTPNFQRTPKEEIKLSLKESTPDTLSPPGRENIPGSARSKLQGGTKLSSVFWQFKTLTILCFGTIPLSVLLLYYIYTVFVSRDPNLGPLLFQPSRTLLVVTIISQLLGLLINELFVSVFEALRWQLASRKGGVHVTTFLGLSKATSLFGALRLLYAGGSADHSWWCIQRLALPALCILVSTLPKGDVTFQNIYKAIDTLPVIAGLGPINYTILFSHIPKAVACLYVSNYSNGFLGAANFVIGMTPVSCSGLNCTSVFLPGGLLLARRIDEPLNGTLLNMNASLLNTGQAVLINKAPGYQLEFFPVDNGFSFNATTDCATYGQSRGDGLHLCVGSNNSTLVVGWSVCPSNLYNEGRCFADTSWTSTLQQTTSMLLYKRYATVAYDSRNLSILSIESVSTPELAPVDSFAVREIATVVFLPGLNATTDDTEMVNSLLFGIGFALRLYQDEFPNDQLLPLRLLQGFISVPFQFSTTAWQWANATQGSNDSSIYALPADLQTTATISEVTYRAIANKWTICVFITLTVILLIWCNSIFLWILRQKTASPNSSSFVEVDIGSKSAYLSKIISDLREDGEPTQVDYQDLSQMLRTAGLGNSESKAIIQRVKDRKIRVVSLKSDANDNFLVLVTANEGQDAGGFESLSMLDRTTRYV